ncbi:YkvA family protein [Rivularia sp. UHCC 0363]|uniref:YkvA family protein n=1 Tax=Rivularia sp. UHCC 0363 TaxID=3110244 RepID=UPI002B210D93|nr:YkvA family protein [Rivularia sp. UHCC 0363]MEA5594072.1 YkvA family protein [Rivularia sp. UHCC 0363]
MKKNSIFQNWKQRVRKLKQETSALYYASKDPRTPWYAKFLAICVVAYLLSPIDLIPDVIPILGYLDDLVLIPLGIFLLLKLIPKTVMDESRQKAKVIENIPNSKFITIIIVCIWIFTGMLTVFLVYSLYQNSKKSF